MKKFGLFIFTLIALNLVRGAHAQTPIKGSSLSTTVSTLKVPTAPKLDVPVTLPGVQAPTAPTPTLNSPSTSTAVGVSDQGPVYNGSIAPVTPATIVNQLLSTGNTLPQQNASYFGGAVEGAIQGATPDAQQGAIQGAIQGGTQGGIQGEQGGQSGTGVTSPTPSPVDSISSNNPIRIHFETYRSIDSGVYDIFDSFDSFVIGAQDYLTNDGKRPLDNDQLNFITNSVADKINKGTTTLTIGKDPIGGGITVIQDQDPFFILPTGTQSDITAAQKEILIKLGKPYVTDPKYRSAEDQEGPVNKTPLTAAEFAKFISGIQERNVNAGSTTGVEVQPIVSPAPRPAPVESEVCVGPNCNQ